MDRTRMGWFDYANYAFLVVLSLTFVIPFVSVLATSLVSENELIRRGSFILFPHRLDFGAYRLLLGEGSLIYGAFLVSTLRVTIGTTLNLIVTSMMAFGLARKRLPGRNAVIALVFVTMLVDGGLVPNYLLIKSLHLTNTFWAMIVPGLVNVWFLIIMKNFFAQFPESLEESATIDGATPWRILTAIILPLSLPSYATIGLFYAVQHWNAWFDAMIYIDDIRKLPLQAIMRQIVVSSTSTEVNQALYATLTEKPTPQSMKAAVIIASTVPILFVYPFIQKHFVKGMLIGSVKG
ncbi:MAG: carbohydrate ABC transporter permease [Paenibacillaceae bacterium]|nr:carbohydrate ABC transporter permease [Paenibacillaceae bacterium]